MVRYLKTNYKLVARTAKEGIEEIVGKTKLDHNKRALRVSREAQRARSRVKSD